MYYVIGLGNPGEKYDETPHNIGRDLLRTMVRAHSHDCSDWEKNKKSLTSFAQFSDYPYQFILPETFMNLSGEVIDSDMKEIPEQIVVVYDDIDLPYGEIRISQNRGSGGHNGIKSIEQHLKSRSFVRFRVGVCPIDWFGKPKKPRGKESVNRYLVNKKLSSWYTKQYPDLAQQIQKRLESISADGVAKAMNQYN